MRRGGKFKYIIGFAIVAFAVFRFCGSEETNEFTGEKQFISMSPQEEIALGLNATPGMIEEFGGLHPDQAAQDLVDRVGNKLVQSGVAADSPYKYEFHLLADSQTINAFALPGGPCFITAALFNQLENEDQLAGVLGHEIGHVIAKHSAARMSQQQLANGVVQGVNVGSEGQLGQAAAAVAQTVTMKYGRSDELQSDDLGVKMMLDAGYNPEEMIGVMKILKTASGGSSVPEWQSSHPNPDNRIEKIKEAIEKYKG
jgi:predicted Zn-dependent protease